MFEQKGQNNSIMEIKSSFLLEKIVKLNKISLLKGSQLTNRRFSWHDLEII